MNTVEEVLENLKGADQYYEMQFGEVNDVKLRIIGGAAMILAGSKRKTTYDIDVVDPLSWEMEEYLQSFSINNAAEGNALLPEGFDDRLQKIHMDGTGAVTFYIPSKEDLILTKINRFDHSDKMDIEESEMLDSLDMELFMRLGEDLAAKHNGYRMNWEYFKEEFYLS